MAGAGPPCSICQHPQRHVIDRALASAGSSNRRIATQYGFSEGAVRRHKLAGHVAEALAVYGRENRAAQFDMGEVFHRNVERLGLAQDAADRWLRDVENPEQYDLGARAEEVTVHYEEIEVDGDRIRTVKRKGKLHTLLDGIQENHGLRVTGFETKFADPRRLLTDYSAGLRGELTLFMQAWAQWQEDERQKELAAASEESQEADLRGVFDERVLPWAVADLAWAMEGLLDEETGRAVAEHAAPRLIERLIERIREPEG